MIRHIIVICLCGMIMLGMQAGGQQARAQNAASDPQPAARIAAVDALRRQVLAAPPLTQADEIIVYKGQRLMYLTRDGRILRKYHIALGREPEGMKMEWGDFRTPEGKYTIDMKNANSAYFMSLRISYPDATDANVAAALKAKPGDWIMIHGLPNDRDAAMMHHPQNDWTNGCIAVTDTEMAEIWRMVPVGTKISIWP